MSQTRFPYFLITDDANTVLAAQSIAAVDVFTARGSIHSFQADAAFDEVFEKLKASGRDFLLIEPAKSDYQAPGDLAELDARTTDV
ncbi:hypothetical protein K8U54_18005 [Pseudomonas fulva]|uniref:hypothetical protein n=1 Tax=Pseudomonas fulva TaxID=47880 RepID=UPI00201E55E9|nr:hypothetical protein [Pseudomonas fulva]UQY33596.1 hypothetical protein K8U54_18005 [Pseudomonas fulva]